MSLLILKLQEKDYLITDVVPDENVKNHIMGINLKYGNVDLENSVIVDGDNEILERLHRTIELDYYTVSGLIDVKWFDDIVDEIKRKNKKLKLNLVIYDSISISSEEIDEKYYKSYEPIETLSSSVKNYTFFCLVLPDQLIIGTNTSSDIPIYKNIDKLKSFTIEFENFDEMSSMFESIKYDTMEIYEEYSVGIAIPKRWKDKVLRLLEAKIVLSDWRSFTNIKNMNGHKKVKIEINEINHDMLTSKEVCKMLMISDQTLANWRKLGILDFKKISPRKYLYPLEQIKEIQKNGIELPEKNKTKTKKKKLPTSLPTRIKENNTIDYKKKITEWVRMFSYEITEQKYKKQNFFLNFGNIGFKSSPLVMINDDFQLVDYIKKEIIFDNEKDLWNYLDSLKDIARPRIDTSKKIYSGYANLYLNKLYISPVRHN